MGGTYGAKGDLHKFTQLLHAMPKLQTRQLKLAGQVAHILAGRGEQIHSPPREISGLGLRERAAIPDANAVFEPAGEWVQKLTVINRSGGQIKAAEAPRRLTRPVELKAGPPAHAIFGLARPRPKDPVLLRPGDRTDRNRGGVLQDEGRGPWGLTIPVQHQSPYGAPLTPVPIGGLDTLALGPQGRELRAMRCLYVKVPLGFVFEPAPGAPD